MKFLKLFSLVVAMMLLGALAHASQIEYLKCNDGATGMMTCESKDFVLQITPKVSVVVITKAQPGATGDMQELTYTPNAVGEAPYAKEIYTNDASAVEVGHDEGMQVQLRIYGQIFEFRHEF